jgi:hypothetical protein
VIAVELNAAGLQLELLPVRKADEEGWAEVEVRLSCTGFHGAYVAWIQAEDVRRFREELADMNQRPGHPSEARLCSAEPDIDIKLKMDTHGRIAGEYTFESDRVNGTPTALAGALEMDQSFLPNLIEQLDELVSALTS